MEDDYLPISMLNAFEYCPRRFYYEYVLGEMLVNEHVLEGQLRHERTDAGGVERGPKGAPDTTVRRSVRVYSDRLRLIGVVDVVEEDPGGIVPLEYKKGRGGHWLNDHVQLCAAALCLEERLRTTITHGFIFYFGPRRRVRLAFTPELRRLTETAVDSARAVARAGQLPPPLVDDRRCRDCSLEPLCLPREVRRLTGMEE
ncbi:MAG TPA: CRISPR-associated protein Cas4 [Chloroflexota bacterium]|nr:CRISPR-associated protein Cas4 [Chloroflexota bacterium]